MKTKGQFRYRAYSRRDREGRGAGAARGEVHLRRRRLDPRPAAARRRHGDLLQGLFRDRDFSRSSTGAAARLGAYQVERADAGPHGRLLPQRGLLGEGPAGERRREQLRPHPHRLLRRRQRARSRRSRPDNTLSAARSTPTAGLTGYDFPARRERAGSSARRSRRAPSPTRGPLLQSPPREVPGPARARGDRRRCSTSSSSTAAFSTASRSAWRASGSAATWRPRGRPPRGERGAGAGGGRTARGHRRHPERARRDALRGRGPASATVAASAGRPSCSTRPATRSRAGG